MRREQAVNEERSGLSRRIFKVSAVMLLFLAGLAAGSLQVFPGTLFKAGWDAVMQLRADLPTQLGLRPSSHVRPAFFDGNGVVLHVKGRTAPGLTLLTGFFDGENELRLIRTDGSIVRRWTVRFFDLFPNPEFFVGTAQGPKTNWNVAVHGAKLLPDGSAVFNFDYAGMVKLDRCGDVLWTVPRLTHHSVERSADGGFWVGSRQLVTEGGYPELGPPPYLADTLMKVSADGKVESEIPVLETLIANGLQGVVFQAQLAGLPNGRVPHTNDIEELSPEMAGAFPQFAAGDLLVSLRGLNTILVLDPATRKIKWHLIGQWIRQHDPDFNPNGRITLFNNNADDTMLRPLFGGSNILEVDPSNGETIRLYGAPEQRMYSAYRGKHQVIDVDGQRHLLITESESGRVIEVDERGEIVWQFIDRYDEDEVAVVTEATRYPESYFSGAGWDCP